MDVNQIIVGTMTVQPSSERPGDGIKPAIPSKKEISCAIAHHRGIERPIQKSRPIVIGGGDIDLDALASKRLHNSPEDGAGTSPAGAY
jgi:hypothetical protein